MEQSSFFAEQKPGSAVKTDIVTKYFQAWASILASRSSVPAIAYVDLFAGSGVYENGVESTPILILKLALGNKKFHNKIVTVFNDVNSEYVTSLQDRVSEIEGLDRLRHPPLILNEKVEGRLSHTVQLRSSFPTFSFIDPFGYLGVTQSLIEDAMSAWGSECVLFFNYNRINSAINNETVKQHVDALFTREIANELRRLKTTNTSPARREDAILKGLSKSLNPDGDRYVLFFRFRARDKDRTSHYIVHLTKHQRGYFIMRDVMAGASAVRGGIPLFEWSPEEAEQLPLSLEIPGSPSIPELKARILLKMRGKTIEAKRCYEEVTLLTSYLRKHFVQAVNELELERQVIIDKPRTQRQRRDGRLTLGDTVKLTFPWEH